MKTYVVHLKSGAEIEAQAESRIALKKELYQNLFVRECEIEKITRKNT